MSPSGMVGIPRLSAGLQAKQRDRHARESGHPGWSRRDQESEELDSRLRGNDGRGRCVDFESTFLEPLGLEPRVV